MKPLLIILLIVMAVASVANAETELRFNFNYFIPNDTDTWDSGVGIEGQLIYWDESNFGGAFVLGASRWDAKTQSAGYYDPVYNLAGGGAIEGDALLIPIGVSGLYRFMLGEKARLILEAGLRYVVVDSDIEMAVVVYDGFYYYPFAGKVDIDNGIVGLAALELGIPIAQKVDIYFRGAYQFDISKGDVNWYGIDVGENELQALLLQVGLLFNF